MKNITSHRFPLFTVAATFFMATLELPANNYQAIIDSATTWDASFTSSASNWNQSAPWDGTPGTDAQLGSTGTTFDLASPNGSFLSFSGTRNLYNLSAQSGTQVISGGSSTQLSIANDVAVSGSGSILYFIANLLDVSIGGNLAIDAGSSVSFGSYTGQGIGQNVNAPQVVVAGATSVSGQLLMMRNNVLNFGDLTVESSGSVNLDIHAGSGAGSNSATIRSLGGSGVIYGSRREASGRNSTLIIDTSASSNGNFSGNLVNSSSDNVSAVLNLEVKGSGVQTLSGQTDYTGFTAVTGGTLIIAGSGSINSSSGITVEEGGTLIQSSSVAISPAITWNGGTIGGNGTISGDPIATDAAIRAISPGNSTGTLTINGDVTLNATSSLFIDIANIADFDILAVTGSIDLGSAVLSVTLLESPPTVGQTFQIVTGGSLMGTFDGLSQDSVFIVDSTQFQISYLDNAVTLAVVPEPASFAYLLAAAGMLFALRRRRES